jgi:hypothetical protein
MKDLLALQTRIKAAWADIAWLRPGGDSDLNKDFDELLDDTKSIVKALDQIVARRTPKQSGYEADEEMIKFLEGVTGAVDADSYAQHSLWERYAEQAKKFFDTKGGRRFEWDSSRSGLLTCVGSYDGRECWISLSTVKIDGHKILFYYASGTFVDHDMVEEWLKANLPDTARRSDGYLNKTDATNFHIVWPKQETAQ